MAKKTGAGASSHEADDEGGTGTTAADAFIVELEKDAKTSTVGAAAAKAKGFAAAGFNPGNLFAVLLALAKLYRDWQKEKNDPNADGE